MFEKQASLALGKAICKKGTAFAVIPKSLEERLCLLETMVKNLLEINSGILSEKVDSSSNAYTDEAMNKDGLPYNMCFVGADKNGFPRMLVVKKDGYFVSDIKYKSLSSAAEAVSGVIRKSGWVFWKLSDGRTIKEAFRNRV